MPGTKPKSSVGAASALKCGIISLSFRHSSLYFTSKYHWLNKSVQHNFKIYSWQASYITLKLQI